MRVTRSLLAVPTGLLAGMLAATAPAATLTINGGGATSSQPTYDAEFSAYTQAAPASLFSYDGVGSAGQTAFLTNNIALFNKASAQYGTPVGTTVHFAASDSALTTSQVSGYTLASVDGPLIQLPTLGVGVTIPFVNAKLAALKLNDAELCGIFSGKITTWQRLSAAATPGTIALTYRSDSSAATFLVTQHLSAVCTAANSSFPTLPLVPTTTFSTLFTAAGKAVPASFVGVSGSSGMQSSLLASSLGLGYISPDYTSVAPKSGNTSSLKVASLINATNNVAYAPSVADITLGLNNPGTGSANQSPPSTRAAAANPLNWVPSIPVTAKGYPIVGYSSWDLSTCYAVPTVGKTLISFLKDNYNNAAYRTLITNNGATPLQNTKAAAFITAVSQSFLTNASGYNINILNLAVCKGLQGR